MNKSMSLLLTVELLSGTDKNVFIIIRFIKCTPQVYSSSFGSMLRGKSVGAVLVVVVVWQDSVLNLSQQRWWW